ncbi:MAG: HD domain-containing protein [Bacteroidota bacterium]
MKNLHIKIISAENTYLDPLESFFNLKYPRDKLITHGMDHHRRVWGYAKELLKFKERDGLCFDQAFIQKLMIGCYLHDIGMSIDPGIRHGIHSRKICLRFLEEQNMNESDYQDLLTAIENHDEKEYADATGNDMLSTLLTIADDLDAFGETGISRYLEIYKERGVEKHELSKAILRNAEKRFRNFERAFSRWTELVDKHRDRYNILVDFFTDIKLVSK